jgi:hypothetical protein
MTVLGLLTVIAYLIFLIWSTRVSEEICSQLGIDPPSFCWTLFSKALIASPDFSGYLIPMMFGLGTDRVASLTSAVEAINTAFPPGVRDSIRSFHLIGTELPDSTLWIDYNPMASSMPK